MDKPLILLAFSSSLLACEDDGPKQAIPAPSPADEPSVLDTPECPVRAATDLADAEAAFAELASCHGLAAEVVTCEAHDHWLLRGDYLDPERGFVGPLVIGRPYAACAYSVAGVAAAAPVYFHLPEVRRDATRGEFSDEGYPEGACLQPLLDRMHTDRRKFIYVDSIDELVAGWKGSLACEGLTPDQFDVECWGPSYLADRPGAHAICRISRFDVGSVWPATGVIGPIHP